MKQTIKRLWEYYTNLHRSRRLHTQSYKCTCNQFRLLNTFHRVYMDSICMHSQLQGNIELCLCSPYNFNINICVHSILQGILIHCIVHIYFVMDTLRCAYIRCNRYMYTLHGVYVTLQCIFQRTCYP